MSKPFFPADRLRNPLLGCSTGKIDMTFSLVWLTQYFGGSYVASIFCQNQEGSHRLAKWDKTPSINAFLSTDRMDFGGTILGSSGAILWMHTEIIVDLSSSKTEAIFHWEITECRLAEYWPLKHYLGTGLFHHLFPFKLPFWGLPPNQETHIPNLRLQTIRWSVPFARQHRNMTDGIACPLRLKP